MNAPLIFSDLTLARRLERAEAQNSARFVEARARLSPESGAQWIEVAGAYAMFDGVSSPLTQTFGFGMFQPVTGPDLDAIEAFYRDRGAPVLHEVSPLAGVELAALLSERGYRPVESRHDVRPSGERLAAQRGTARFSDRLHPHQVATGIKATPPPG